MGVERPAAALAVRRRRYSLLAVCVQACSLSFFLKHWKADLGNLDSLTRFGEGGSLNTNWASGKLVCVEEHSSNVATNDRERTSMKYGKQLRINSYGPWMDKYLVSNRGRAVGVMLNDLLRIVPQQK